MAVTRDQSRYHSCRRAKMKTLWHERLGRTWKTFLPFPSFCPSFLPFPFFLVFLGQGKQSLNSSSKTLRKVSVSEFRISRF